MKLTCPQCETLFDIEHSVKDTTCPSCFTLVSVMDLLTVTSDSSQDKDYFSSEGELLPGDQLAHFRIIRQIGQGGFGTVFEAHDRRLDRNVALKVPRTAFLSERQASVFIREAQAAAQLQVPNIVAVYEVGRTDDRIFIVTELIHGVSLSKWARQRKPTQKESVAMAAKLANAIHLAHEAGVIHRDLKPGNILIDEQDEPHITDFGLAKRFNSEEESITRPGAVMGTPAYMSPEQAMGQSETAAPRTDVYSLGVMFYELLTATRPFSGDSKIKSGDDIFRKIKNGMFVTPREQNSRVSLDAESVCLKAMALLPDDRYETALDFAADLDNLNARRPVAARPVGFVQASQYFCERHWLLLGLTAIGLVFLIVNLVVFFLPEPEAIAETKKVWNVEFQVSPSDAQVVVAPLDYDPDSDVGKIDFSQTELAQRIKSRAGWRQIKLAPGTYLIEARSTIGVQQVYRVIPESKSERQSREFKMTEWSFDESDENLMRLHAIEIVPPKKIEQHLYQLGTEQLVHVESGEFLSGNNNLNKLTKHGRAKRRFPEKHMSMPSYLIGQTEVTAKSYFEVMGKYPYEMPPNPGPESVVTNVTWLEAAEYCERIGARFPTYDEYVFAATNRGTTTYPFGNRFLLNEWPIGNIMQPEIDVTKSDPPIYNLYSSVGEWSWTINLSTDSEPLSTVPGPQMMPMWTGRLVLGIPPGAPNDLGPIKKPMTVYIPSYVQDNKMDSTRRQNGFRVGVGLSPQLMLTEDD